MFPSLNEGKNGNISLGCLMQFTVFFEFTYKYWNLIRTKQEILLNISLELKQRKGREQMQFIPVEVFIYLLFIFDCKALFVCVKDSICLRIAISAYYFSIFGSIFDVLFSLLFKS